MNASTIPIIGTVLAASLALARLMMQTAARRDLRVDHFEDAMAVHRGEMQRRAERDSGRRDYPRLRKSSRKATTESTNALPPILS